MIYNKFFNARHSNCKRIVLSENFREIFSASTQGRITFVPAGDERLLDNERNAAMCRFVALREGSAVRAVPTFPEEAKAGNNENSGQQPPAAVGATAATISPHLPAADADAAADGAKPPAADVAADGANPGAKPATGGAKPGANPEPCCRWCRACCRP